VLIMSLRPGPEVDGIQGYCNTVIYLNAAGLQQAISLAPQHVIARPIAPLAPAPPWQSSRPRLKERMRVNRIVFWLFCAAAG
jgi:hypothetical protein